MRWRPPYAESSPSPASPPASRATRARKPSDSRGMPFFHSGRPYCTKSRTGKLRLMRDALLRRYHDLPPVLRSAAATLRGGYLRAWRYSPETERLRDEALAREHWSAEQWRAWREERLAFVLH